MNEATGVSIPAGGWPVSLGKRALTSTVGNLTYNQGTNRLVVVLTTVDMTCTGAEPVQCFAHIEGDIGERFYWDSQSTGEGLGVTFSWRGMYVLPYQTSVMAYISAASSIIMGFSMSGYAFLQLPLGQASGG